MATGDVQSFSLPTKFMHVVFFLSFNSHTPGSFLIAKQIFYFSVFQTSVIPNTVLVHMAVLQVSSILQEIANNYNSPILNFCLFRNKTTFKAVDSQTKLQLLASRRYKKTTKCISIENLEEFLWEQEQELELELGQVHVQKQVQVQVQVQVQEL